MDPTVNLFSDFHTELRVQVDSSSSHHNENLEPGLPQLWGQRAQELLQTFLFVNNPAPDTGLEGRLTVHCISSFSDLEASLEEDTQWWRGP